MKINVTENKVSIKEEQILNENEYNIHKIQFDFSSEYTDDLVKVALFSIDNHTYKKIISNNECDIPPEVLTKRGYSILGVYAYKTEQDTLVLRYSPSPTRISVYDGSYKAEAENSEPITPSEIEQYQQILQNSLQQFQNQYNVLVEETEGDIQAIEDELQRKVDEGYFDGEDGFSPIANVIQLSNGVKIEIEDKTGRTSANVFDGYSPQRGVDYWTQEDKEEVIEEATQEIDGKIEEYNTNAEQKVSTYNTNAAEKLSAYNTNATEKLSAYNTNATEKISTYNSNAEQKEISYNTNASQKLETFNTNANSKLSEYNTNAETKITAYDENATQKITAYNTNSTQKTNDFNQNATQKTNDFDNHTEEIQENIENLQAENERLRNTLPTTTGTGQVITLNKTAELEFKKPPLPMGNSEQVQYSGKQLIPFTNQDFTLNGVRHYVQNGTLYLNGTTTTETNQRNELYKSNFSMTLPAGTYYFKRGTSNIPMYIIKYDNNTNIITNEGQFTLEETTQVYFGIYLYQITLNNKKIDCQLELGNSATSYEPYTYGQAPNPNFEVPITNVTGDVEVVVGNKNLAWNGWAEDFVRRINNIYSATIETKDNKNCLKQSANAGWGDYDNKYIFKTNFKENTQYTLVFDLLADRSARGNIGIEHTDGTVVEPSNLTLNVWNKVVLTSSPNKTIKYIRSVYRDGAEWIDLDTFMVYEGTEQIDFIPHKEQKFIFPLGNEKLMLGDYLADDGIHHVRGQVVLDGSEDEVWEKIYGSIENGTALYSVNKNHKQVDGLSNKFVMRDSLSIWYNGEGVTTKWRADKIGFMIYGERINNDYSISAIRNLMNNNPVTVEYELEEEVIVPYTSAQQTVYNAIKQALSYEEQTNISSNQNAIFNVEAYLDSKIILSEKVNKIEGKGLSTNDFTNEYKNNVDSNTNARHTHSNKSVLDNISSNDVSNWNGKYDKPSGGIPKTDLDSDVQTSLGKADTSIQSHQDISGKQDITDNTLTTINKTVPTAINEVNSIAKGANQALSYSNYQAMITAFNALANDVYNVGQNVMIITLNVPDLWISGIESTNVPYTYTTDEAFTTELATNGYVQVGYYKLSALETQKVDLTNYVTNTDYANPDTGGVIKTTTVYGTGMSNGQLRSVAKTFAEYQNANINMFISKATLENVITGKSIETATNKVTSISNASTNTQYPSAKAVYDYIQSLDGDEVSY